MAVNHAQPLYPASTAQNDPRLQDPAIMKWVDRTGWINFGHAQLRPERPRLRDLLGVHKWVWDSDLTIANTAHDAGGIKLRYRRGRQAVGTNVYGFFRFSPGPAPDGNVPPPPMMRCHVNRLQIGGPNNWLLTMTGPTGTVTARLYWTRQPGDQNLDAVRNRAGHTRLLCLRYPDPRNAARDIELFGVPQLGRKASGVDGPTGYPPAEDWPLNDAYGNERADLDEFGIGILQPSRAWDYWLLKKGYQRNMWKMGLEIDGYNAGVGLLT